MNKPTIREVVIRYIAGVVGTMEDGNPKEAPSMFDPEVFDHRDPSNTEFSDIEIIECIRNFGQLCIDHAAEWVNG